MQMMWMPLYFQNDTLNSKVWYTSKVEAKVGWTKVSNFLVKQSKAKVGWSKLSDFLASEIVETVASKPLSGALQKVWHA